MLSVSDVVKLAAAGVKVDLTEIRNCIDRDENLPSATPGRADVFPATLVDAFWERWRRAHSAQPCQHFYESPYAVYAHEYAGTVYVMVCPHNQQPFVVEDHGPLYPSDALMAKLALYESTQL